MTEITDHLQHCADCFPLIDNNSYSAFIDAKREIEQLRTKVAELEHSLSHRRVIIEKAFILREQAESVGATWRGHCRESAEEDCKVLYQEDMQDAVNDLRQQANDLEKGGEQ